MSNPVPNHVPNHVPDNDPHRQLLTIEDARRLRVSSTWFETANPQLVVERLQMGSTVYWSLWHLYRGGRKVETFETKKAALHMGNQLAAVAPQMARIVEIDQAGTAGYKNGELGPDDAERRRLVALTNDAYLSAKRETWVL